MNDYQLVLQKQKNRFDVLRFIYQETNGEEDKLTTAGDIGKATGISIEEVINILKYLQNEGLVKFLSAFYQSSELISIKILHQGVVEIEAAITKPDQPTEHFVAQIFHITNNAPISTQQFGNQNTL
jgi:DNA-directed RNA polymerase specialized sigma subunit